MVTRQERTAFAELKPSILRLYAEVCTATVPDASWDQTWFAFLSLKGHLQDVPNFEGQDIWASPTTDGRDYRITVITRWHSIDALQIWVTEGWSAYRLLLSMNPPAFDIECEVREQVL